MNSKENNMKLHLSKIEFISSKNDYCQEEIDMNRHLKSELIRIIYEHYCIEENNEEFEYYYFKIE